MSHLKFQIAHRVRNILHGKISQGFTLPELVIVIGIFLILATLITLNLTSSQSKTTLRAQIDILTSNMNEQQIKAMQGDSMNGTAASMQGIHFEQDRYVLFQGASYSAADTKNFTVMGEGVVFANITFPNNNLLFSQASGEVSGYTPLNNSVTVRFLGNNEEKTITINQLGIITSIN